MPTPAAIAAPPAGKGIAASAPVARLASGLQRTPASARFGPDAHPSEATPFHAGLQAMLAQTTPAGPLSQAPSDSVSFLLEAAAKSGAAPAPAEDAKAQAAPGKNAATSSSLASGKSIPALLSRGNTGAKRSAPVADLQNPPGADARADADSAPERASLLKLAEASHPSDPRKHQSAPSTSATAAQQATVATLLAEAPLPAPPPQYHPSGSASNAAAPSDAPVNSSTAQGSAAPSGEPPAGVSLQAHLAQQNIGFAASQNFEPSRNDVSAAAASSTEAAHAAQHQHAARNGSAFHDQPSSTPLSSAAASPSPEPSAAGFANQFTTPLGVHRAATPNLEAPIGATPGRALSSAAAHPDTQSNAVSARATLASPQPSDAAGLAPAAAAPAMHDPASAKSGPKPPASKPATPRVSAEAAGHPISAAQLAPATVVHGSAIAAQTSPAADRPPAPADPQPAHSGDVFAALDGDNTAPNTWIHTGPQHAEAAYLDPALGWVGVRANVSANALHASIVPASTEAAQVLNTHLAGLNTYMAEHHADAAVTVSMTDTSAFGGAANAGQGSNQHSASRDNSQQSTFEASHSPASNAAPPLRSTSAMRPAAASILRSGTTISLMA